VIGRFLRGFLFGVSPHDLASYGGGVIVLVATALLAAYLPARRVIRIDPSAALRR
jgi:putative ABC transport system permease protein